MRKTASEQERPTEFMTTMFNLTPVAVNQTSGQTWWRDWVLSTHFIPFVAARERLPKQDEWHGYDATADSSLPEGLLDKDGQENVMK